MSAGAIAANGARTVQSFCRICTAVCGILVDVSRVTGMAHYSGIPVTIRPASAE